MNTQPVRRTLGLAIACLLGLSAVSLGADIVHDAEYYILEAQNGERGRPRTRRSTRG